jgi:hypothetical protein
MIKLLVLLFIFVSIYAHETIYNLPDNHSRLQHELDRSFKSASQILIITPSLHHPKLSKKFLSAVKKGGVVNLIVQDPGGDPLSLIQYKNVALYLSSVKLDQTVIIVDHSLVCTGDASLNEELYSSEHSVVRCSDSESKIRSVRSALYPLIRHAKPYLE